jgi:integrase
MAGVHPLGGKELRALRRLQRETPEGARTVHVFVSERLAPLSVPGYQRMVARAGEAARFPFLVHSHMLRHSCGYKLANDGQALPEVPAAGRFWVRRHARGGSWRGRLRVQAQANHLKLI